MAEGFALNQLGQNNTYLDWSIFSQASADRVKGTFRSFLTWLFSERENSGNGSILEMAAMGFHMGLGFQSANVGPRDGTGA